MHTTRMEVPVKDIFALTLRLLGRFVWEFVYRSSRPHMNGKFVRFLSA
ncbi:MAG: hypothetical protein M3458_13660 [Acidobacteriota bacterium]|nr:hypothetical protein [Acidobacteriota bacterium]